MIVVACNTASTVALPRIRERFTQPVIGVVPAIKPAAVISQSKTIALLATPGTVNREYTHTLIDEFAKDCTIISVGSSELVQLAERKLHGEAISPAQLQPIVAPIAENPQIDTIVLACTHFPLLKEELQQVLPNITHWVDSGEAIARRVGHWLNKLGKVDQQKDTLISSSDCSTSSAYFTEENSRIHRLENTLQRLGIHTIRFLPIQA
jgi:glutamate racemase